MAGLKWGMNIADDADSYMDAPALPVGGGGGDSGGNGGFIANLLDMLGIHKQVANGGESGPNKTKTQKPPAPAASKSPDLGPLPIPDTVTNRPSRLDQEKTYTTPIKTIDPTNDLEFGIGSLLNSVSKGFR